jgi:hypothetical protein
VQIVRIESSDVYEQPLQCLKSRREASVFTFAFRQAR